MSTCHFSVKVKLHWRHPTGFIGTNRENHAASVYLALSQLWLTTLSEKLTSANGYGIIALTGRAHCQRQVAFFSISAEPGSLEGDPPMKLTDRRLLAPNDREPTPIPLKKSAKVLKSKTPKSKSTKTQTPKEPRSQNSETGTANKPLTLAKDFKLPSGVSCNSFLNNSFTFQCLV